MENVPNLFSLFGVLFGGSSIFVLLDVGPFVADRAGLAEERVAGEAF